MDDSAEWRIERAWANPSKYFLQGPKTEGARDGMLVCDSAGNAYVACGTFIQLIGADGAVRILAGTPGMGGGTDGPPWKASFGNATAIAIADDRTLYVTDSVSFTVRRLRKQEDGSWLTDTVAGVPGQRGHRDGPGAQALFDAPLDGIAVDGDGAVYVMDGDWLRRIDGGKVTTLNAGSGEVDGPLANARFRRAMGGNGSLCGDGAKSLYVADRWNMSIRKVDLKAGTVTTIAGKPPGGDKKGGPRDGPAFEARFNGAGGPMTVVCNPVHDFLLVRSADERNVRIVRAGWIKTLAAGGAIITGMPRGVDAAGNSYIDGGRRLTRGTGGGAPDRHGNTDEEIEATKENDGD